MHTEQNRLDCKACPQSFIVEKYANKIFTITRIGNQGKRR